MGEMVWIIKNIFSNDKIEKIEKYKSKNIRNILLPARKGLGKGGDRGGKNSRGLSPLGFSLPGKPHKGTTMQAQGKARELFEAFSRVNNFAYADTRLLANHVLSKTPHCHDILERFARGEAPQEFGFWQIVKLVFVCWAANLAVYGLLLAERFVQWRAGLRALPKIRGLASPLAVVDIFTLVNRINSEGKFKDYYLPGLYEALEARGHSYFILARLYGGRDPRVLRKTFEILRGHEHPVLTEGELMQFDDWLRLLWFALSFPFAVLRITSLLGKEGSEGHIRAALIACLGQNYLSGERRRLAGRRLAEVLPESAQIISWYENQVVDKCFYRGLWEGKCLARTYAAQLLTWPDTLLNNHADPADAKHHAVPAFVLVNGSYYLPEPLEDLPGAQGSAEGSIESGAEAPRHYFPYIPGPAYGVGPALRYKPVFETDLAPNPDGPALFLLSYHPEETRRCLALARPLADSGVPVAFKFHPATKVEDYQHLLPGNAALIKGGLAESLAGVSLVIGSGSGALGEAVAMGVPAINIEPADGLGLNYLPDYGQGELWERAATTEELFAAKDKLLAVVKGGGAKREESVRHFRSLIFGEPTKDRIVQAFDL